MLPLATGWCRGSASRVSYGAPGRGVRSKIQPGRCPGCCRSDPIVIERTRCRNGGLSFSEVGSSYHREGNESAPDVSVSYAVESVARRASDSPECGARRISGAWKIEAPGAPSPTGRRSPSRRYRDRRVVFCAWGLATADGPRRGDRTPRARQRLQSCGTVSFGVPERSHHGSSPCAFVHRRLVSERSACVLLFSQHRRGRRQARCHPIRNNTAIAPEMGRRSATVADNASARSAPVVETISFRRFSTGVPAHGSHFCRFPTGGRQHGWLPVAA